MLKFRNGECSAGSVPYTIRKGDTLQSIATQYNTSVNEILRANLFLDPFNLTVGLQICVPLKIQFYPACLTTNYYIVKPGDTFLSIANYFNVTENELEFSNYGINPNDLYKDQILCIPVAPPPVRIIINTVNKELMVIKNSNIIRNYPIEINIDVIPKGSFIILNKQVDPGDIIGASWLGLSKAGVGIHGTNTPQFIDIVATNESIILSNQDMSELFNLVTVGTEVEIF